MKYFEAEDRADIFVPHAFPERTVDLGEIRMNYAVTGDPNLPALLLIPAQSESWWGYEQAMPLLAEHFQVFAVDLRGQGRSTWTPGRYTLDNFGNDLVRFIRTVIARPTIVSGLSSGGTIAAWLSAFAEPGQIRAAIYEDPPLFASEANPAVGQSIRQGLAPMFLLWNKWLGDQWSIGNVEGLMQAMPRDLPPELLAGLARMMPRDTEGAPPPEAFQSLREYDPEWGRAFATGTATAACDHANMLAHVKVPVLLTHHVRHIDESTGRLLGAMSDLQAARVRDLVTAAGQPITYRSFPEASHAMHSTDPKLYAQTVIDWVADSA
ncbi:alpha/beta fold hydrolase [Nocardia heshunensis]